MGMSFTDIDDIIRNICLYYENRVLMSSDIQSLALTYGIELGSVMLADNLSERILLLRLRTHAV